MDQRVHFISVVNESNETFTEICERFGISRKTGYKWVQRYEERGAAGLADHASAPHSCPHKMAAESLRRVIDLRKEHPTWGPKKLRARLQALGVEGVAATSTIGDALKRYGLIRPSRKRAVAPPMSGLGVQPTIYANDTWCVDFKGNFPLGDKTQCYPLTITDHTTRYLLKCEGLAKTDVTEVKPHFERAFREFGLPTRIRSDNGPPFATVGVGGLSALSVWWMRLGIELERIEPGHPEQNGRHERMHRTLKAEVAQPPSGTMLEQQLAFDVFRRVYNTERPHEALDMKTPSSRYTPSRRRMPEKLSSPEYPDSMKVRKLTASGCLRLGRKAGTHLVSRLLAGEPVGLEQVDEDVHELYYGTVLLAEIVLKNKEVCIKKVR